MRETKSPELMPAVQFGQMKGRGESFSETDTQEEDKVWLGLEEIKARFGIC